jgi:hypothetical protein
MFDGVPERMLLEALKHAAIDAGSGNYFTPAFGISSFKSLIPESIGDLLSNPATRDSVTLPRATMVVRYAVFTDPVRLGQPSIPDLTSLVGSAAASGLPSNLMPLARIETSPLLNYQADRKSYAYVSIFRRPDGAHVLDISRTLPEDVVVVTKSPDGKFVNISDSLREQYRNPDMSLLDNRRFGILNNSELGVFKPVSPRTGDFVGWLTHVVNRPVTAA